MLEDNNTKNNTIIPVLESFKVVGFYKIYTNVSYS